MENPKPGYKTTEFWLTLIANLIGVTLASGLVLPETQLGQGLGLATVVLSNLGYTVNRSVVKARFEDSRRNGRATHATTG